MKSLEGSHLLAVNEDNCFQILGFSERRPGVEQAQIDSSKPPLIWFDEE